MLELSLDGLVVIASGVAAKAFREQLTKRIDRFVVVESPIEAFDYLKEWLKRGDSLLLKASRKIALDQLLPKIQDFYG